jgi:hypothetical protein
MREQLEAIAGILSRIEEQLVLLNERLKQPTVVVAHGTLTAAPGSGDVVESGPAVVQRRGQVWSLQPRAW